MTTVRELRETAVLYRNGPAAARVATAYAGLVFVAAVIVLADLALGGPQGVHTFALVLVTLPSGAGVVFVLTKLPGLPDTSGLFASGYTLLQVGLFTGAGLAQSWVVWCLGRGPRID